MLFDHLEEKEAVMTAALIEHNGYKFYHMLATRTHSEEASDVFFELAEDELRHLKVLETRYFPEAGFDPDLVTDEELAIEEYLENKGAGDIFTRRVDMNSLLEIVDSPKKALNLALDTERHSVMHFEDMAMRGQTPEVRKLCQEIAEEEKKHLALLEDLLSRAE